MHNFLQFLRMIMAGMLLPNALWAQTGEISENEQSVDIQPVHPQNQANPKSSVVVPVKNPEQSKTHALNKNTEKDGEEDVLAVFVLQRGFYVAANFGAFMTFGGMRGYSNVQPYVSLKPGFDINDYLGVQASLSCGYSSRNRLSKNDHPSQGGQSIDTYGLFNLGLELVASWRPTARFAVEPRLGGGISRIYPQPTDPKDVTKMIPPFNPHLVSGVDFKYLTLLTDFIVGLSLSHYYIIGPNIPAGAASFVVRYTF